MDLKELEAQVVKDYEQTKERMRRKYKLARELGFTPQEARVLSFKSFSVIHQLADERQKLHEKVAP